MTFAGLLNQTLVLKRTTATSRDVIGGREPSTEDSTSVAAYVFPLVGEEDRTNRNTQIGEWRALVPAGTDVDGWDRAEYDGREFDIVAPPERIRNPRLDVEHHVRLRLQEVR